MVGTEPPNRDYTTGEVAEILDVSPAHILELCNSGKLKFYNVPGGSKHRRITKKALADYQQQSGITPDETPHEAASSTQEPVIKRLLTTGEAAQLLDVSIGTIGHYVEKKKLNGIRTAMGHRRIYEDSAMELLHDLRPDYTPPSPSAILVGSDTEFAWKLADTMVEKGGINIMFENHVPYEKEVRERISKQVPAPRAIVVDVRGMDTEVMRATVRKADMLWRKCELMVVGNEEQREQMPRRRQQFFTPEQLSQELPGAIKKACERQTLSK